jgi:polysaccharide export outer membrane protein
VEAGRRVEAALRAGSYLVDPHVSITVAESRSQRVSVLGEVRTPGRYAIESNATVFDVLAQAGGGTEDCAEVIYVLREEGGRVTRFPVDLNGMADGRVGSAALTLKPGDSVYLPRAERFYVYGEVQQPNMYRLEPGMSIVQAIARAGGITPRGSERGIELRRRGKDGGMVVTHAKPTDTVQADDVIRVKERLF